MSKPIEITDCIVTSSEAGLEYYYYFSDLTLIRVELTADVLVTHINIFKVDRKAIKELLRLAGKYIIPFFKEEWDFEETYIVSPNKTLIRLLTKDRAEYVGKLDQNFLYTLKFKEFY